MLISDMHLGTFPQPKTFYLTSRHGKAYISSKWRSIHSGMCVFLAAGGRGLPS